MPTHPRPRKAASWIIRSVPVRTRDSAERLNQVYRRLLADTPATVMSELAPWPRPFLRYVNSHPELAR